MRVELLLTLALGRVAADDCFRDDGGNFFGFFCNAQDQSANEYRVCKGDCVGDLPDCEHGSQIFLAPFDPSTNPDIDKAELDGLQLAQRCVFYRPAVQGKDGAKARSRGNSLVWFPLAKRPCTWADAAAVLGLESGARVDDDFIYKYFMVDCAVQTCNHDYKYKKDQLPCFGLHTLSPSIYLFEKWDFTWCQAYATGVKDCNLLPVCRTDHPIFDIYGEYQAPFFTVVDNNLFNNCEDLCEDGESNWRGTNSDGSKCRRLYSDEQHNPDSAYWLIPGGFCTDELSIQKDYSLDCNKRPLCDENGKAPPQYGELNPFGSEQCVPYRANCRRHEFSKYHCDPVNFNNLPFCPAQKTLIKGGEMKIYDDCDVAPFCEGEKVTDCTLKLSDCSTDDREMLHCAGEVRQIKGPLCAKYAEDASHCEPMVLCLDTIRKQVFPECEELCLSMDQKNCRHIPAEGQPDPFNVLGRIKSMHKEVDLNDFFAKLNKATGKTFSRQKFDGLQMCSEEESITRSVPSLLCGLMKICEKPECAHKLTNCNEDENNKYVCASTIPPLCEKYEVDATRVMAGECSGRLMCPDLELVHASVLEKKLVSFYSLDECEVVCEDDTVVEATTTPEETTTEQFPIRRRRDEQDDGQSSAAPASEQVETTEEPKPVCRARPTVDHDPWKVAVHDGSRAREWCSPEKSVLIAAVPGCNKLPICNSNSSAPDDAKLNPFYAVDNECVQKKADCTEEESKEIQCANILAAEGTMLMPIIAGVGAVVIIIVVVAVVFIVMKKGPGGKGATASTMSKTNTKTGTASQQV